LWSALAAASTGARISIVIFYQALNLSGFIAENCIRPVTWTWSAIDFAISTLRVCFIALEKCLVFFLYSDRTITTKHNKEES
jgi:hypothetical protein